MLSVVGEEYVAYSESVKGQYSPIIAIARYDGTVTYREVVKEDLLRISDDKNIPGGWLFRKTQNASASWVKRFVLLRGDFLFFFHGPQNDKPIAVVPLGECTIVTPEQNGKTFDEARTYRANEGFEFDIRHPSRATVRLYALNEDERAQWIMICRERISDSAFIIQQQKKNGSIPNPAPASFLSAAAKSNISVTSTKLSGLSLLPADDVSSTAGSSGRWTAQLAGGTAFSSSAPIGTLTGGGAGGSGASGVMRTYYQQGQGGGVGVAGMGSDALSPYSLPGSPPPSHLLRPAGTANERHFSSPTGHPDSAPAGGAFTTAGTGTGSYSALTTDGGAGSWAGVGGGIPQPRIRPGYSNHQQQRFAEELLGEYVSDSSSVQPQQQSLHEQRAASRNVKKIHERDLGFDILLLEENLKKKLSEQLEARKRENAVRAKLSSRDDIQAAQAEEQQRAPVSLAELFRLALFFIDEEVAEDPQPGTPLQMPHLKGHAIEDMLMAVYQRYCGSSGFMSLEEFIEFLEDSAILQTHVPHNENDEPVEEFVTLMDPVRLLTLVPRNIGFTSAESYDVVNEKLSSAVKEDKFIINFSQFYLLLLRITQIVYPDIYTKDATLAFNKVLLEVMLPMFIWSRGGHLKRGARDVLVLEERILLLATTYAPNLWRVFLNYAQDAVGKVPEVGLSFPDTAQLNEKGMFKLPPAAPLRFFEGNHTVPESLFVSESGFLKFARDYGITPYVVSNKQLRELYRSVNRHKIIVSSRLPTRDQLHGGAHSKAQMDKQSRKKDSAKPMKFNSATAKGKGAGAAGAGAGNDVDDDDDMPPPPPPPLSHAPPAGPGGGGGKPIGGIGFSEFIELIARVAVDGLHQENYNIVFPTPFSKVLAIFTVWGVADLKKLEEVRIIHTDEMY